MSKFLKIFFKVILIFFGLFFVISFFVLGSISKKLGQPSNYLLNLLQQSQQPNPYQNKDKINFLVLGLDERDDILEKTTVTDTIIFASLNLKNYHLNTISIPRDLWFYDLSIKINQIYPLSLEQPNKFDFIKEKFSKITGQNIDHTIIIKTTDLVEFVKLIGGVDLTLEQGFIDTKYPNPEYIKNPSKEIPIYKTVEFKSGLIHLDESNITEFVRSRHGGETVAQGGTDLARIQRQQLLIEAILTKVKSGQFISSQSQLFELYKFWNNLSKDITDLNGINIASLIGDSFNKITISKINIPIGTNAKNGSIYHPNRFINKQWVFIPSSQDYQQLHQFFSESIN